MKRRAFGSLLLFGSMFLGVSAFAADYYVAPTGNDGGPGSKPKPWKTLAKANAVLKAGDTLFLRKGEYRERIVPKHSGAKGRPIVYRAFEGETPILIGAGENAVSLSGNDFITLQGLTLDGKDEVFCGIFMAKEADHVSVLDCVIKNFRNKKNTGGYGIWVSRKGGSHLLVENCKIFRCGTTNPKIQNGSNIHIFRDSSHIVIRGCDIYESHTEDGLHLGAFGLVTEESMETFYPAVRGDPGMRKC